MTAEPKKDDWDTLLASLQAAFAAAGIPLPLTLARRVVEMIKRHWTQDGKLAPHYEREKALEIVEEAIEPLAGAHLEHAEDLDHLKRGQKELKEGQDQIVTLLLRTLLELEGRPTSRPSRGATEGAPSAGSLQSVYLICGESDRAVAERLRSYLIARGADTYFFAVDALPGSRRARHQHREIGAHDRVVLCCSKKALLDPDVLAEVEVALEREHEEGASEILIPAIIGGLKFERDAPGWWRKDKAHIYDTIRRRAPLKLPRPGGPGWDSAVELLVAALRVMPGPRETGASRPRSKQTGEDGKEGRALGRFEGPTPEPHFRGRKKELAKLERLLKANRTACVVVTGIGGIGKTTLVRRFVERRARKLFPDGVAWIDGNPERFSSELARVATRFGWDAAAAGREPTPEEAVQHLNGALASQQVLVVVDSFDPEQSSADHVPRPWPDSRTVVTSRTRTLDQKLDAAQLELDLWPIEICRDYLRERCSGDCPWVNTVGDSELDDLAHFVGRLPLGVRLLVSVLRNRPGTTPAEVLALLWAQPLGTLDKYDENRGVAATFRWGYEHLSEPQRVTLRALAACARRTRADIVATVAEVKAAREALDDLRTHGFAEIYDDSRWGLHDIVRMFVLDQSEAEVFAERQFGWVRRHLETHAEPTAFREFAEGVDEAMHAIRHNARDTNVAHIIYRPLFSHLLTIGRFSAALELSQDMLKAATPDSEDASNILNNLGTCYLAQGDPAMAIEVLAHSLAIADQLDFEQGQANSLGNLGACYLVQDDVLQAVEFLNRALAIDDRTGNLKNKAKALANLGVCHLAQDEIFKAIDALERSIAIATQFGLDETQANSLGNLGLCHKMQGEITKAIDVLERSLVLNEKLGSPQGQANALGNLGACYWLQGNITKAIDALERALALDEELGRSKDQATTLVSLGLCYLGDGDAPRAIRLLKRAGSIAKDHGHLEIQAGVFGNLAYIAQREGTPEQVRDNLSRALTLYRQMRLPDDHPDVAQIIDALARLPGRLGRDDRRRAAVGVGRRRRRTRPRDTNDQKRGAD